MCLDRAMQRKGRADVLSRAAPLHENWRPAARAAFRPLRGPRRGSGLATPRVTELSHWASAARRFRTLAELPWPVWLDSAAADAGERFDILVADPYVTLRTRGAVTEIAARGQAPRESQRPPFELVREQLGDV